MTAYFDTGILLKLYTAEPESAAVQSFILRRAQPVRITELHLAECASAFRLKQFRGECTASEASNALSLLSDDIRNGVLRMVAVDWGEAWSHCRALADSHAAKTGCRTLDTLHVASAMVLSAPEFVTSDRRQAALARRSGLKVIDPKSAAGGSPRSQAKEEQKRPANDAKSRE